MADKYPEKLNELKALYDDQAKKNHIYPFIDWDDVLKGRLHHVNNSAPGDASKKPDKQSNTGS